MKNKIDPVVFEIVQIASEGERKGKLFINDTTVREVLERAGKPNTPTNQNYVRYKVSHLFPRSSIQPGDGDNGGFIHLVIWSK